MLAAPAWEPEREPDPGQRKMLRSQRAPRGAAGWAFHHLPAPRLPPPRTLPLAHRRLCAQALLHPQQHRPPRSGCGSRAVLGWCAWLVPLGVCLASKRAWVMRWHCWERCTICRSPLGGWWSACLEKRAQVGRMALRMRMRMSDVEAKQKARAITVPPHQQLPRQCTARSCQCVSPPRVRHQ